MSSYPLMFPGVRSSLVSGFGPKPPASGFQSYSYPGLKLLHPYGTDDKTSPLKTMGCLSRHLVSSASIQKWFCGICPAFTCSFDESVGEKMVSLSYSSATSGRAGKFLPAGATWEGF